jgi:hypothetical protein
MLPAKTIPNAIDTVAASRICAPKHFCPVLRQTSSGPRRFTGSELSRLLNRLLNRLMDGLMAVSAPS